VGHRRAPHGHHRVANELLERPAVGFDGPASRGEVLLEHVAHVLVVASLAEAGEADQVAEQDRQQAPQNR